MRNKGVERAGPGHTGSLLPLPHDYSGRLNPAQTAMSYAPGSLPLQTSGKPHLSLCLHVLASLGELGDGDAAYRVPGSVRAAGRFASSARC
jgi:hypothetical protein